MLKKYVLQHEGVPIPDKTRAGRRQKTRRRDWLEESITDVSQVKEGKVVPKDIVKAASNIHGLVANYNQSFRALKRINGHSSENEKLSFQLIIPYLKKFKELNPNSVVKWTRDQDNQYAAIVSLPRHYERQFKVCAPGNVVGCLSFAKQVERNTLHCFGENAIGRNISSGVFYNKY